MYKVFYNDRTVFFMDSDSKCIELNDTMIHYFKNKEQLKSALNNFLNNLNLTKLYIVYQDIDHAFKKFSELYTIIEAAGGLVKSERNTFLVIYRRGKWDLPKGKLEKNESPEIGALREVEEECGINNLKVKKLLKTTYHTYKLNGKNILKRTYWFEMSHAGEQKPTPQIIEEITEVKWLDTNNFDEIIKNTFPSIIDVLKKGGVI